MEEAVKCCSEGISMGSGNQCFTVPHLFRSDSPDSGDAGDSRWIPVDSKHKISFLQYLNWFGASGWNCNWCIWLELAIHWWLLMACCRCINYKKNDLHRRTLAYMSLSIPLSLSLLLPLPLLFLPSPSLSLPLSMLLSLSLSLS